MGHPCDNAYLELIKRESYASLENWLYNLNYTSNLTVKIVQYMEFISEYATVNAHHLRKY